MSRLDLLLLLASLPPIAHRSLLLCTFVTLRQGWLPVHHGRRVKLRMLVLQMSLKILAHSFVLAIIIQFAARPAMLT
jgi:hypothetical protein